QKPRPSARAKDCGCPLPESARALRPELAGTLPSRPQFPRPRRSRQNHVSSWAALWLVLWRIPPVPEVPAREPRCVRADDRPRQPAEIFLLRAVTQRNRHSAVVPQCRGVPEQDDLADGRPQRVVAKKLLLHALRCVLFVLERPKTI